MVTPDTLGLRLKRSRLQLAANEGDTISPAKLAARLGVTGQAIGRYEADDREPDLGMIVRLAAVLGVTPGWLAFGEAAMVVPAPPNARAEGVRSDRGRDEKLTPKGAKSDRRRA